MNYFMLSLSLKTVSRLKNVLAKALFYSKELIRFYQCLHACFFSMRYKKDDQWACPKDYIVTNVYTGNTLEEIHIVGQFRLNLWYGKRHRDWELSAPKHVYERKGKEWLITMEFILIAKRVEFIWAGMQWVERKVSSKNNLSSWLTIGQGWGKSSPNLF